MRRAFLSSVQGPLYCGFAILDIQDYLQNITKRNVDIVEPAGLVNPYRREAIMNSREPLYVVQ